MTRARKPTTTDLSLTAHVPVGPSDAPLIILGPSLGAPASMWDRVATLLVPDFRVQTFEHLGHAGAPPAPGPFTVADLADAVVELIDRADVEKAYYAGDSISGAIGLELAYRHPDRVAGVAAICSVARRTSDPSMAPMAAAVRQEGTASRAADVGDRWFAQSTKARHADDIAAVARTMSEADDETYARYLEALDAHDVGERLAEISVPVLSIWTEFDLGDAEGKMRHIADGVQDGALVHVGGAGHLPPYEQPEALADALRRFLSD